MVKNDYELTTSLFPFDFTENEYPVIGKIREFERFEDKWHYDEGHQFDRQTIAVAVDFCFYLYNNLFTELDAFPGLDGEILIKAYFPTYSIEIFLKDSLIGYYNVEDKKGNDLFNSGEMSIPDLKKQILSQRQLEWNLSGFSPSTIMRKSIKDSIASPSETHQALTGAAFPLYVLNAQPINLSGFVTISGINIANIPTLLSIGNLALNYYQPTVGW